MPPPARPRWAENPTAARAPASGGAENPRKGGRRGHDAGRTPARGVDSFRAPAARADDGHTPRAVRLRTVGDSLSQDATRWLGQLVRAAGHVLERGECAVGGASLADHWQRAQALALDPADPAGRYPPGRSLVESPRLPP
jgi:hypothetical protein